MVYDQKIEETLTPLLTKWKGLVVKKMFGGIGYLVQGHMAVGIHGNHIIFRLGPEDAKELMSFPYSKPFDITGKPLKGWAMIEPRGFTSTNQLIKWLNKAKRFVSNLDPKP